MWFIVVRLTGVCFIVVCSLLLGTLGYCVLLISFEFVLQCCGLWAFCALVCLFLCVILFLVFVVFCLRGGYLSCFVGCFL